MSQNKPATGPSDLSGHHPTAKPRKRPQRAPVASEMAIQAAVLDVLRVAYPDVFVFSVPNGGMIMDPRTVAKLKWQGLTPGVPDLVLCWKAAAWESPRCGFLEVKRPGGYLSPEQKAVHAILTSKGHRVAVVRSVDELHAVLDEWGVPTRLSG